MWKEVFNKAQRSSTGFIYVIYKFYHLLLLISLREMTLNGSLYLLAKLLQLVLQFGNFSFWETLLVTFLLYYFFMCVFFIYIYMCVCLCVLVPVCVYTCVCIRVYVCAVGSA